MRTLPAYLVLCLCISSAFGGERETISGESAYAHVGDYVTVCGTVASAKHATASRGQPTFLDFDRPYPNETFVAVIWGTARPAFGEPEVTYLSRRICVSGVVATYRGKPEMVLTDPKQLTTQ